MIKSELFFHMSEYHDLLLTDKEEKEIIDICRPLVREADIFDNLILRMLDSRYTVQFPWKDMLIVSYTKQRLYFKITMTEIIEKLKFLGWTVRGSEEKNGEVIYTFLKIKES